MACGRPLITMRQLSNLAVVVLAWILTLQAGHLEWLEWLLHASELFFPARIGSVELPFEWPSFLYDTLVVMAPTLSAAVLVLPWIGLIAPNRLTPNAVTLGILGGLALLLVPLWAADVGNFPGDHFGAPPWLHWAVVLSFGIAGSRASTDLCTAIRSRLSAA